MSKFNYDFVMEVLKIDKIVINIGVGDVIVNVKVLDSVVEELVFIIG